MRWPNCELRGRVLAAGAGRLSTLRESAFDMMSDETADSASRLIFENKHVVCRYKIRSASGIWHEKWLHRRCKSPVSYVTLAKGKCNRIFDSDRNIECSFWTRTISQAADAAGSLAVPILPVHQRGYPYR